MTCKCGGNLIRNIDEILKVGRDAWICDRCNGIFILDCIGTKPDGWRTKEKLKQREEINKIPF